MEWLAFLPRIPYMTEQAATNVLKHPPQNPSIQKGISRPLVRPCNALHAVSL